MNRKNFLKSLGFSAFTVPLLGACSTEDPQADPADNGTGDGDGTCSVSPTETEGPFPTKSPGTLVLTDVRSDRAGVMMQINLTIQNVNNNCAALEGAMIDIWHCDKDGNYSEYGGTGMQSSNYQSVHFLRGRQTSNASGFAGFVSIFPGWYSGRAPHIHVHVYNASGKSLLVTQIAFPKSVCDVVYNTSPHYSARGTQDTTNGTDNVFRDGVDKELAAVEGSIANGYTLTHTIKVSA